MGLLVIGAGEQREVERVQGMPRLVIRPARAIAMTSGEHPLHRERRADLDPERRLLVPVVGERVPGARLDLDDVSRLGDHRAAPTRNRIRPDVTSKRSVWIGWTWEIGTAPPGLGAKSKASSSPSVVAAVSVR